MTRLWIVTVLLVLAGCAAASMPPSPGPCAGGENTLDCQAYRYRNGP